jgi:redox-sensitive bicupin YhaK (pirin superfamily)
METGTGTKAMIELRPYGGLGRFRNDWLDARHHFSFGGYRDPARMGFGRLRVWNDDIVAPGAGFDPHPHREMEIATYIRQGAITHLDDQGNEGVTDAGDVQVMHAGTGIVHSEYNRGAEPPRLFQIWIMPDVPGAEPGWGTRAFPRDPGALRVLASGRAADAGSGALPLHANAALLAGTLDAGQSATIRLEPGRGAYLMPSAGSIAVGGIVAATGDGIAVSDEDSFEIVARERAEIVLVDVAMR